MTVETIIGKSAEDIATLLAENWGQCVTQQPQLAVVPEPVRLSEWLAQADPPTRDQVMLAGLVAEDGGNSCDAVYVLAWMVLPVAAP